MVTKQDEFSLVHAEIKYSHLEFCYSFTSKLGSSIVEPTRRFCMYKKMSGRFYKTSIKNWEYISAQVRVRNHLVIGETKVLQYYHSWNIS